MFYNEQSTVTLRKCVRHSGQPVDWFIVVLYWCRCCSQYQDELGCFLNVSVRADRDVCASTCIQDSRVSASVKKSHIFTRHNCQWSGRPRSQYQLLHRRKLSTERDSVENPAWDQRRTIQWFAGRRDSVRLWEYNKRYHPNGDGNTRKHVNTDSGHTKTVSVPAFLIKAAQRKAIAPPEAIMF